MMPDHVNDLCPNCSAALLGPYCTECGQHQVDLDRPFLDLLSEGFSTFFAFDTRLFRTVWPLIRRPGFLTLEFLAGRRARYVHPFKLYFAFSLVFFLVFSFSNYTIVHEGEPGIISIQTSNIDRAGDSSGLELDGGHDLSVATDDETTRWINEFFAPLDEFAETDPAGFDRLFIDRLSKSLIILVPMVALLLQMLYWRPRFVAHLVFSLHLHCFSFLILVAGAIVDGVTAAIGVDGGNTGNSIATLAIAVYAFLALRRVYGQGRFLTFLKLVMLLVGYALALVVTMIATLVVTVAAL